MRRAARFVVDFVVGDDPWVAGGVVVALGLAALADRVSGVGWALLAVAVPVVLAASLRRAVRRP